MHWRTWLWARLLLALDNLFGTQLVERELARRQAKIDQLLARTKAVNQELEELAQNLALQQLTLCLIELKARSERDDLDDWLSFAPPSDEALLDSAIACLVKPRLAAIDEIDEINAIGKGPDESGRYIYHLHPDWAAIMARLDAAKAPPQLVAWLEEQSKVTR